jgi:hypothetical protein
VRERLSAVYTAALADILDASDSTEFYGPF